jgi:hypothetical protein
MLRALVASVVAFGVSVDDLAGRRLRRLDAPADALRPIRCVLVRGAVAPYEVRIDRTG